MRRASVKDAPALARLESAAFASDGSTVPWTAAQLAVELSADKCEAWVTDDGAGYLLSWRVAGERELVRIAVEPAARRRGVGRALLTALLDAARRDGDGCVHLEVAASNAAARAFYQAAGFTEVGRRQRYYRDGDDAILMRLDLELQPEA